jgi:hypothetical protein
MEERIQEILNQEGTKTSKIQHLILLGLTRTQIARLVTNGNYGFVQNVYAKMRAQGILIMTDAEATARGFNRRFGVEFEAYNVDRNDLCAALNAAGIYTIIESYNHITKRHWKIVTDSSIRGSKGFELVSPILQGEAGIIEMKKVCNILNQSGAKVNSSCGTHVHIDAQGINLASWKRIYINYARLEKVIDDFMPKSRKGNNNFYSKGYSTITNFEAKISSARSLKDIDTFFGSRYFKINPKSYARHNTIEFRQHSGTIEFGKINIWVRFLGNLITFSEENFVTNASLEGMSEFNSQEIITYLTHRTNKLKTR